MAVKGAALKARIGLPFRSLFKRETVLRSKYRRQWRAVAQQPEGDATPDDVATAVPLAIACAVGSVIDGIVALATHGDGRAGVGTMISGLRPGAPASVAVGGIVAST
jgi:hypothetical protein